MTYEICDNSVLGDISPLNSDVLKEIFKILTCQMYTKLSLVSKDWKKLADDSPIFKDLIFNKIVFSPHDWNHFLGPLPAVEMEEPYKLLPKNFVEILAKKCTAFLGKRILDTHKLIWIPEKIKDKPLTVNCLKIFLEQNNNNNDFKLKEGDTVINSGWVLMANEVIAASLGKPYLAQQNLLDVFNRKDEIDWQVPKLSEVITCLSLIYLKFGKNTVADPTYTWCQEKEKTLRRQIAIKYYADSLMHTNAYFNNNYDFIGVAPIWHL